METKITIGNDSISSIITVSQGKRIDLKSVYVPREKEECLIRKNLKELGIVYISDNNRSLFLRLNNKIIKKDNIQIDSGLSWVTEESEVGIRLNRNGRLSFETTDDVKVKVELIRE